MKEEQLKRQDVEDAYKALGLDWDWISLFIDFSNGFTFKKDLMAVAEANGEIEKEETPLGIRWRPSTLNTHPMKNNNEYSVKNDPVALPEGQTDTEEIFQCFPKDDIQFRVITPSSYDGTINGLLNADEEHTGEEVQNSRGFYKRMTLEEFKKHFSSMTDQQIKDVQIINNKDGK